MRSWTGPLPSYRRSVCTLVMASLLGAPAVVRAGDPKAQQELEQAEQALVNLEYEAANKQATRVTQMRALTHEQLVRATRLVATTDAVLDKETAARDAFQLLLTYDPTYASDSNLGPKVQAPFMEARGFMRAQPSQPGVDASVVLRPDEPGTLRVTTHDPTHIGKRIVAAYRWGGDGPFLKTPLAMTEGATIDIPAPPPATSRLDYYVQVLDERDGAAFESGNPNLPKTATVLLTASKAAVVPASTTEHHSVLASPIFWAIVGVAVVGAGTGVYLGARKSSGDQSLPTSASLVPTLKCNGGPC